MNTQQLSKIRLSLTIVVCISIWFILIWQHFTDGVPSHHLLQRADMPAISNWWGAVLLPALTWLLMGRIQNRIQKSSDKSLVKKVTTNFFIAIGYGILLSQLFTLGYSELASIAFPAILIFAMFFKVYKEEFILGFILSMSLTFGAVLPTIFTTVIGSLSFVVYHVVRFIWRHSKDMLQLKKTN